MSESSKPSFERAALPGEIIIPVSNMGYPGIIFGKAYVIRQETVEPDPMPIEPENIPHEIKKFEDANRRVIAEYQKKIAASETLPIEVNDSVQAMLEADLLLIESFSIQNSSIIRSIQSGTSAHKAVYDYMQKYIKLFSGISNPDSPLYDPDHPSFGKHEDYKHILQSFQGALDEKMRSARIENAPDNSIPVCKSIPVGDLIQFRKADGKGTRIDGMINSTGSDKDHVNIMARSSKISVAILPQEALNDIRTDDELIIDGPNKLVIQNPAPKTIEEYKAKITLQRAADKVLLEKSQSIRHPITRDNQQIKVSANTGYSDEMGAVKLVNAARIGLHRTEIGVLAREGNDRITEDKWYDIFKCILKESEVSAVTFRTVDFEGDKIKDSERSEEDKEIMIRDQMRAALRLKEEINDQKVHIMFPMIRTPGEFRRLQDCMDEEAARLNIEPIHCGMMVEAPAILRDLGKLDAAFFSVGTNDFIPALLAYDRYGKDSDKYYDPTNPTVIEALEEIIKHRTNNREVSLCGDMATDPRYLPLLAGIGFKHVSSGVSRVPLIKELISRIDTNEAKQLVEELKNADGRKEREAILDQYNHEKLGLKPNRTLDAEWTANDAELNLGTPDGP